MIGLKVARKVWDAKALSANEVSPAVDTQHGPFVSAFGNASGATDIVVQYSADGSAWYEGAKKSLTAAGDFAFDLTTAARFVRLKSSAAVTVTAFVCVKG